MTSIMTTLATELIPAVGYIRMSTDQQEDSPERQKGEIKRLAERDGYRVVRWYEDHGLSGTESANRPQFLQLMADAQAGHFRVVLVYEQSRLSREDIFDAMMHWRIFREAGVKVVSVQRGEIRFDDLGGIITLMVDQYSAHDESRKMAQRSVSGRIQKAKQKIRPHGCALFGMDRICRDEHGNVVRRVHFRERFRKAKSWTNELAPSADTKVVDAIRWAFQQIDDGCSMGDVMREFQRREITGVKGVLFDREAVGRFLRNPAYAGHLQVGKYSNGKFARMRDEAGELLIKDAHPGIVSDAQFQRVQRILDLRKKPIRSPAKPGRYLLSGLVTCAYCGHPAWGNFTTAAGDGDQKRFYSYVCSANRREDLKGVDCPRPSINKDRLERMVLKIFRDRVLCDANRERLIASAKRMARDQDVKPSPEQDQLNEIRAMIAQGTKNLALAGSREDFLAVSGLLKEWREQAETLESRIAGRFADQKPQQDAMKAIDALYEFRDNLDTVDRCRLADALRHVIRKIEYGSRTYSNKRFSSRVRFGRIDFHPGIIANPSIEFDERQLSPDRKCWQIIEYIRAARTPKSHHQIAKHFGYRNVGNVGHAINLGLMTGYIEKHPSGVGLVGVKRAT